ncbi:MAG TPA: cobyric acid synthase, partial [Pseudolysinimonas sp.]|nr:cobyric acid synthase [Pseudolysinimonas sp.]
DVGNVTALARRAGWRGLDLNVIGVGAGDTLPPQAHLVHIGSGPASARKPLHTDVARHAATLRAWADDGVPFLAIAAGWQLLGREVTELDGTVAVGAGVFPSSARVSAERTVGEVAGESELGEVAGFVNYGAETTVDAGAGRLARLGTADEGIVVGDLVATHLHGPFLPMNPVWADRLLEAAAHRAGVVPGDPDPRLAVIDDYARRSRAAIRARLR